MHRIAAPYGRAAYRYALPKPGVKATVRAAGASGGALPAHAPGSASWLCFRQAVAMVMIHWLAFVGFQRTDWLAGGTWLSWLSIAVAYGMVLLVWVVLVPMFFERLRHSRQPQFAR